MYRWRKKERKKDLFNRMKKKSDVSLEKERKKERKKERPF